MIHDVYYIGMKQVRFLLHRYKANPWLSKGALNHEQIASITARSVSK